MQNLKKYVDYIFEKQIVEKKGISPAIYKDLEEYFTSSSKHSFAGAQKFIHTKKKGWNLSEEDFEEAKKKFKKK
jgi:hypothetical protein